MKDEPRFTLGLLKAVLLHQWVPISGMSLEPEQLRQVLGAGTSPAAALAFKAATSVHFDILFNDPAASTNTNVGNTIGGN